MVSPRTGSSLDLSRPPPTPSPLKSYHLQLQGKVRISLGSVS